MFYALERREDKKMWNSSAVCHNKLSFYDFSTTEKQQENSFSELKWISNFSLSLLCCVCLLSLASHPNPLSKLHPRRKSHSCSLPFMNLNAHCSAASPLLIFIEFFIITIRLGHDSLLWLLSATHHCHCQCSAPVVVGCRLPHKHKTGETRREKNCEGVETQPETSRTLQCHSQSQKCSYRIFSLRMDFYDFFVSLIYYQTAAKRKTMESWSFVVALSTTR